MDRNRIEGYLKLVAAYRRLARRPANGRRPTG